MVSLAKREKDMEIRRVGVVGCGLMGSGIAQIAATAGYETLVREVSQELLDKGFASINKSLAKFVEKGTLTAAQKRQTTDRLKGTLTWDGFGDCDLVIEAVIENLEAKKQVFRTLDPLCKPETILASNTSSFSITEIMAVTKRPDRFIGLHFFNPVQLMKLVEVVRTIVTDEAVCQTALRFAESVGKVPVRARDTGGFIVNRLLVPYLLDAVRAFEEGVGSIVDIDNSMKLGCGYPMGPFVLQDFIGLDTTYNSANSMFDEFREKRFAPPPLLKRLVLAGHYGKKTGRGFYDWSDPRNPKPTM
jgi:3-hydroxybutyryl-CoA dehydrogenase